LRFLLSVENSGYARWLRAGDAEEDKGAVHLAAHLLDENERIVSWYHAGAFLPTNVMPNDAVDLEIAVRAPETPGSYTVEFDMVAEHVTWFEDQGSSTLRHPLIVA
jgi:hypothetical protein